MPFGKTKGNYRLFCLRRTVCGFSQRRIPRDELGDTFKCVNEIMRQGLKIPVESAVPIHCQYIRSGHGKSQEITNIL